MTGDHTYMATGIPITSNIQVVRTANGQTASTSSTALIGSPSPTFAFTGGLARVPANGAFISSGYATTNQPTFDGTAGAYAIVQLFARPLNVDAELPLGETVADSSGHWSLATGPLAAGGYVITAKVTPPAGYPSELMALYQQSWNLFHRPLTSGRERDLSTRGRRVPHNTAQRAIENSPHHRPPDVENSPGLGRAICSDRGSCPVVSLNEDKRPGVGRSCSRRVGASLLRGPVEASGPKLGRLAIVLLVDPDYPPHKTHATRLKPARCANDFPPSTLTCRWPRDRQQEPDRNLRICKNSLL